MITAVRGGYPDVAYYLKDGRRLDNKELFICRVETEQGMYVKESLPGLNGRGATQIILRTPVKLDIGDGHGSIIFEGILYGITSIERYIPDNRTRGLIRAEAFAEYIIKAQ